MVPYSFTIPQSISAEHSYRRLCRLLGTSYADEYLDGIVSGDDAVPFEVRDSDMTLVYSGSPVLLRLRHTRSP